MRIFVLGKDGQALMPCHPARARQLLKEGRGVIHRRMPMVIRLKDRKTGDVQPVRVKIDPGSKFTGLAVVREKADGISVLNLFELLHRGRQISEALTARRAMRRARRNRHTRYRQARFLNRTRPDGWLAPSLQHRVDTVMSWVDRLQRWVPVSGITQELVRFDMQAMENPDIEGAEYQQGTLAGYEVREYLLEKWGRKCAYCGEDHAPLQVEHIHARAAGGTNRVSNLTLACEPCNTRKGTLPIEVFLKHKPEVLARILAQAKRPLKDAAAVNATRWSLFNALKSTGLPVEVGSGGKTKFNRVRLGLPKTHALDAVCAGNVDTVSNWEQPTVSIKCAGRGSYQRTRLTAHGFPRGYLMRQKAVHGFQTGDMVKANVPSGKKTGRYVGRVAVRVTGRFNIQASGTVIQGISHKHCTLIQRGDGYGYQINKM